MLTCPFHYLTGWDCPFCGGQRMVWAMLHGRFGEAFLLNPVAFLLGIAFCLVYALHLYNCYRAKRNRSTCATKFVSWCTSGTAMIYLLIILGIWGIARNVM